MLIWDLFVGGVAIGCVYSLVALGFTMIMRATGIIHFAQGEVLMIGSMVGLTSVTWLPHLSVVIILLIGMFFSGLVAVAMELLVYRTLRVRKVPAMNIITATVGMSILCINAARLIWGSEPMRFPDLFGTTDYVFAGAKVSPQLVAITFSAVVIAIALQLFLNKTRTGLAMQAVAQDAGAAQLMGANLTRMTIYTYAIAGMMAGAAGIMFGSLFFSFFQMGFIIGLKGFIAAVLGGVGSLGGAMLGGIVFGLLETFGAVFISSAYKDGIGMGLLILILFFFPSGLVGLWRDRK